MMNNAKNARDYDYLKNCKVQEIIHFTNIKNLKNIAEHGILPRALLDSLNIPYTFNDHTRMDGKEHINL